MFPFWESQSFFLQVMDFQNSFFSWHPPRLQLPDPSLAMDLPHHSLYHLLQVSALPLEQR